MSKENNNLRLLGSPVNLSYRGKKKDDKKNRNRPHSALQNSCFTPDIPDRYKRPFSADAKEQRNQNSTRNLLNSFNIELIRSFNTSPTNVKILPPTADILGGRKSPSYCTKRSDREICSNASDYGSEDTYISLGTKIKAKAQSGSKPKNTNKQNFLRNRTLHKKNKKQMDGGNDDKLNNDFGFSVKIVEKPQHVRSSSPFKTREMYKERSLSPSTRSQSYESYFLSFENAERNEDPLAGRVSFGTSSESKINDIKSDAYSRRLALTKQQLSLVEEESIQDLESVASQRMPSLPPEDPIENSKNVTDGDNEGVLTGRNTYVADDRESEFRKVFINESRAYTNFYDEFRANTQPYDGKLTSTMVLTDSSSKDSGYPDSNNEKAYNKDYSLPSTSVMKKSNSHNSLGDQPKSLDSASTSENDKNFLKTSSTDKKDWTEPLNHSRLLYKDFFLKKEGHVALPPQNSPIANKEKETDNGPKVDEPRDFEYPSYLLNSTTKAYTSKVIEDYKKEIEAINNLHELTIKDIKTDAISPTPLDIDKIFEVKPNIFSDKPIPNDSSEESVSLELAARNRNMNKVDVSKVSTKELIQNYLKVKEGDRSKNGKRYDVKKICNLVSKYEHNSNDKTELNNKTAKPTSSKSSVSVNIRNPTQKTMFTIKTPISARIDSVQTDKDIESWMSMSAPSPRILELDQIEDQTNLSSKNIPNVYEYKTQHLNPSKPVKETQSGRSESVISNETCKPKELDSKSTVLDIYSMLKEIEGYADNPVTTISTVDIPDVASTSRSTPKEDSEMPKDNFMEIFEFLEKVEQSANDALSVVTKTTPQATPKLEALLKLPHTELAQRLVTASLQLEERSCCITLLQESLANHKEQMIQKVSNLEKQSHRNIAKVKQECEDTIKRHQNFIDQLINDKKTLNHRIEQLVDERRSVEDRWRRAAANLEERYKLEMRSQHDKMAAAQQVARQRWVRQKAEKIKELTVKGLEGELRDMADRQQKEIADIKMSHAEVIGRMQAKHAGEMEDLRREMQDEKEQALVKERQLGSSRLEKQILELELSYQEQRTRLIAEMRAENERHATDLSEKEKSQRDKMELWRQEQEKLLEQKRLKLEHEIAAERDNIEELLKQKQADLEKKFEQYKKDFESEQNLLFKKKVTEIAAQHKKERDEAIERAIESMDAEAQAGRKEMQDAMRRNKEQYEAELKELAETEQATLRRYQDAQARVRTTEEKCAELEVSVSQLETRNRVLTEKNTQLEFRVEEIKSQCEESWKTKLENLLKEMDDLKKTHEEQMHQLYAKVKVAVARKDSAIQALTREAGKNQEKITLLEQKLQQQRKDYLKHK